MNSMMELPLKPYHFAQLSFAWDQPETADGLMRMRPRKPGKHSSNIPVLILILL